MGEYEIGSEAWMRERIEHGLDPDEGDRPDDRPLRLKVELAGRTLRPKSDPPPRSPVRASLMQAADVLLHR